jgi:hypothetical protein
MRELDISSTKVLINDLMLAGEEHDPEMHDTTPLEAGYTKPADKFIRTDVQLASLDDFPDHLHISFSTLSRRRPFARLICARFSIITRFASKVFDRREESGSIGFLVALDKLPTLLQELKQHGDRLEMRRQAELEAGRARLGPEALIFTSPFSQAKIQIGAAAATPEAKAAEGPKPIILAEGATQIERGVSIPINETFRFVAGSAFDRDTKQGGHPRDLVSPILIQHARDAADRSVLLLCESPSPEHLARWPEKTLAVVGVQINPQDAPSIFKDTNRYSFRPDRVVVVREMTISSHG